MLNSNSNSNSNSIPIDPKQIDPNQDPSLIPSNNPVPALTDPNIPALQPLNFTWGIYTGQEVYDSINNIYDQAIHWKRNFFMIPMGSAGTRFVNELARLFQAFADNSSLERISMKAITVFQILMLQKTSKKSRTKIDIKHLHRRLDIWQGGDFMNLFNEGKCLQERLSKSVKERDISMISRTFKNLMEKGRVKNALRLLSNESSGGVLGLDDLVPVYNNNGEIQQRTTHDLLIDKHPMGKPASVSSLLSTPADTINPIVFDQLNADLILQAAMHTQGAAGLSGLDAYAWRRLCSSFKTASHDLCNALAAVARRICSSHIHPEDLSAFVACRLIPLNKCPGVRPIGVGETSRRIIAKAVLRLFRYDIQDSAGPLQVCAGQEGGCEAAIHAMRLQFDNPNVEGILLVDATNAFNTLNRQAALHNIQSICPTISQILVNTYRSPIRCIIKGSGEINSSEGTTQGDPLAMAMYALAVKPLICQLRKEVPEVNQVWYADDASGAGSCSELKAFWNRLNMFGEEYGYNPNASKTVLIVKEQFLEKAREQFANTGIEISTDGKRHLGAAIGSRLSVEEYVRSKVSKWVAEIGQLAQIAVSQPHAAYTAFTHGLSSRWIFLSRTLSNISELLQPLEDAIHRELIPAITGRPTCSQEERDLLALPVRFGGLGIINPTKTPASVFQASQKLTTPLVKAITAQDPNGEVNVFEVMAIKGSIRSSNREQKKQQANDTANVLSHKLKRCVDLAREKGASSWLSVLPIKDQGFSLSKGEFRDAICLRYGWCLPNTPLNCNCGLSFTTDHAMICPKGGFPTIRHNELRDITATTLTEVCHNVATEPYLQPLTGEILSLRTAIKTDGARLDIRARGFWSIAQDAYFDVRVFHPNASSNSSGSISSAYKKHEDIKKRAYGQRVREIEHGVFTPLIFSTTGGLGREATTFYKRLADLLSNKRNQPYSIVLSWLRCRLSFAMIRSAIMCIRGSRSSVHHPVCDNNITLATAEGSIPQI